jgi:hypothetical protein
MNIAPTAAFEILLRLPPLHLEMEAEALAGIYRLSCSEQWKPKTIWYGHADKIRDMMKEPILQMGADKIIPMHTFNKSFTAWLPDRSEWGKGMLPLKKGDSSGIQMGPRQMKALELGCAAKASNKASALA